MKHSDPPLRYSVSATFAAWQHFSMALREWRMDLLQPPHTETGRWIFEEDPDARWMPIEFWKAGPLAQCNTISLSSSWNSMMILITCHCIIASCLRRLYQCFIQTSWNYLPLLHHIHYLHYHNSLWMIWHLQHVWIVTWRTSEQQAVTRKA